MSLENVKQKRKHVTISMISDADSKVGGIQFVAPIVPCGTFIKLKHKTIITLAANTCQSFTALDGLSHGDCPNGDYSDELKYGIEHLSQGENQSDFERQFFGQMRDVANSNVVDHVFDGNVLSTLEGLYPGRIKGTAFAFSGHDDNDNYGIIRDRENRNPVDKLYHNCGQIGARRQNSVGLSTLFSRTELDFFDDRIVEWLDKDKKNFFRTEETLNGERKLVYPKYSFVYLLQSLIQLILVDYEGRLLKLDEQKICDNWNSFLNNLSDKRNEKSLFGEYNGDTSVNCPKNFIEFCLNKFLDGTGLLEEIKKDASAIELYANASTSLSNCLKAALHANQIAAITVDDKNLTRGDYFIGANNFLYAPLSKCYKRMDENLKSTLESLSGLLKYKQIELNQTKTEIKTLNTDEIKNTFGYNISKVQEEVKNENGQIIERKAVLKATVPTYYNPNISRDNFRTRMREIEEYNKITDSQFLRLDLERISEYANSGFCISAARAKRLICDNNFMRQLYNKLTQDNVDEKYKRTYRIIFVKLCELEQSTLYDFLLNRNGLESYLVVNFLPEAIIKLMFSANNNLQTKILCELDTQEIYKNRLMESIDADIICCMLRNKNRSKKANEILKLCLEQLQNYVIKSLDFSNNGGLDSSVRNSIIFSRIKDLSNEQVQQIDLSDLDEKCVDLLISDDYLSKLTKQQLTYLFSNRKDLFEKLTPQRMLGLISNNAFIGALNKFKKKKYVLSLINFERIINFAGDSQSRGTVICFIAKYINELPDDKIISLLPSLFFQEVDKTNQNEKSKSAIRDKMNEVQKENILYQNIFKLRNCDFKNKPWEQLIKIFTEINGVDEQKKLIRYLFMNYESYFVHLNALLEKIAPENTDSPEISSTKKLVIDILKSPTEENKLNEVKIINEVVGKISFEDVSDLSNILNSIVETFVDDLDIPSLKKVRFSELQPSMLQKLLNRRFDDIPAEPYSDLILDFNSVEEKITKFDVNGNKDDLKNLEQKQDGLFGNIVVVNNFFIDRGKEEGSRVCKLQLQYPFWRLLSFDLATAETNITKLEGTGENGKPYTREEKLMTIQPNLSDMYDSLQKCMSKLNKDNPIYSALADVQPVLKQWNEINDSIKPMDGVMDRFSNICYNIDDIRKKGLLRSSDAVSLKSYIDRLKTMLEMFSSNDIKSKIKSIEAKIASLKLEKQQKLGQNKLKEIASLTQEITNLTATKEVLNDAEVLQRFVNKDEQLKGVLDKLKNQLEEHITTLSNIKGQDVIQGTALDDFLKSFDMLEKIKGELQAKTDSSNDKLLELYFGDFKDKLVSSSYCKIFKDMKLKGTLYGVLQSVEPGLIEMFTAENKPINYDVLRSDDNLYYSKAKSYFFNQINKLGLNMSAVRKCLLNILSSVDINDQDKIDEYDKIVKQFVKFNAGTSNTGDMEELYRANFDFSDENGDTGPSLSAKQISELGVINMLEGAEEYTPDFMLKNLHRLVEHCSKINGADDAKYDELKKLGTKNLAFKSVQTGESKVILESYFDHKNLFDNCSCAQLVFNTFRDIKCKQLKNLDLQFGKENSQMSMNDGAIAQNFYLLLEKVYNKIQSGESIAQALSGLSIDDMKALAFLLGDWIAGNSDFYRENGFDTVCNIIEGRIMFGCQSKTIDGVVKPELEFTKEQRDALIAHAFLTSKKFSDRVDEIGQIESENMHKIMRMLLEKDDGTKFALEDISKIQSYSVKTDYAYQRIKDDVYNGTAIDHDQGNDVILDCFSQSLSDLMEYLLNNMEPQPSLTDLLKKTHQTRLDRPNGMWWQSIPKSFIKSRLKDVFKNKNLYEIRDLMSNKRNSFINLTKCYKKYVENLDFGDQDILDIVRDFIVYYGNQISIGQAGNLFYFLKLVDLLSSNEGKPSSRQDLLKVIFNELIEKCRNFDSFDVRQIVDFFKNCQGAQNMYLNCDQTARLIFKGNYFTYGKLTDNCLAGYRKYIASGNSLSCCDRFDDLMKEFIDCRCMVSDGRLSLIDYIKIINCFFYRDMFCMLLNGSIKSHDRYEPIGVEKNEILNYEYLGNILDTEFSNPNWNNILDDLYRIGFKLTRDFGDSLSQLLKSSITKTKDSDTFKGLPSRLCDVYSVFKISLHECNSIENIEGMFDTMKGSDPLKVAIDNGQISFSESKVLAMKLLAALRAKENGIAMDCKVEKGEVKRGLTNKSFITILKYLSEEGKEDQNYFDVQDKSPQKQDFKKDFDLVVKYVVDNFDNLFSDATSESCSSDFNNVVSFLNRFSAVVPKEHLEQQLSQLRNRLKVPVKNITVFSNIQPPKVSTDIKTETEKIDSSTNNQITDVTNDIENKNVIDVTQPTTENTEKNSTNPQSSKVLTTESLTNYQNQINLAIVDTNSKSITSIQPKEGTEKLTNIDIELNKTTDIKTETEKIDSSTNNKITGVTNDIENENVIDVTSPTTKNTEKNSTNPQSSEVLTTESLTNYQNQINLAIVDTNSKSITSIQPKEGTEKEGTEKLTNTGINNQTKEGTEKEGTEKLTNTGINNQTKEGTEKLTNIDIELNKTTDIKANNDQKNSEETNQASGIGYAIPVILTFISLILWAISVYLGFPLPWTIGSGIVTTVTSVSWIIKLSIKSPEDEFLPMLNEKTDEQPLNLVKNISHEHTDVPEQAVGDDQKDESTSHGK